MNKWVAFVLYALGALVISVLPQIFHFPIVAFALLASLVVGSVIAIVIGSIHKHILPGLGFLAGWITGCFLSLHWFTSDIYNFIDMVS